MATNSFSLEGVEKRARDFAQFGVRDRIGTGLAPGVEQRAQERFQGPMMPTATTPAPTSAAAPAQAPAARPAPVMPTMMPVAAAAPVADPNSGPIWSRPRRRSGRSGRDPDRIAERMARRGDPRFLMQRASQKDSQDFQMDMMDRTDARRAQERAEDRTDRLNMFDLGQQAEATRDAREWDQAQTMFGQETERRESEFARDTQRRDDEFDRGLKAQIEEEQRQSIDRIETVPTADGSGFVPIGVTKGGNRRMAGGFNPTQKESVMTPEQFAAYGQQYPGATITGKLPGGSVSSSPKAASKPVYRMVPGPMTKDKMGRDVAGPEILAQVFDDGTYEALQPRAKDREEKAEAKKYSGALFE